MVKEIKIKDIEDWIAERRACNNNIPTGWTLDLLEDFIKQKRGDISR